MSRKKLGERHVASIATDGVSATMPKHTNPSSSPQDERVAIPSRLSQSPITMAVSGLAALIAIIWAYWPTLVAMVDQWYSQPDYSHGFLVIPIALFFLWTRRSTLPGDDLQPCMWGVVLLLAAAAGRILAGRYYLLPLDGWTLPIAVAGAVWLLYGKALLKWSWPAIVFMWFMVPIPYSAERWLSVPLQAVATRLSTATLVMLGEGAIAEGNVILLGDNRLFVDEACSGLRIFVGIFALAFAFVLFSRWSWWQKVLVLLAALPVAIVANVTRIVVTGLMYQWISSEAGQKFSHDAAGFIVIPLAAALLWLFLTYLDNLFPQMEEVRQPGQLYQDSLLKQR